jgi:hypothetical protein
MLYPTAKSFNRHLQLLLKFRVKEACLYLLGLCYLSNEIRRPHFFRTAAVSETKQISNTENELLFETVY